MASNLEVVTRSMSAIPATNVIPGEVRVVFNIRFNDRWTPETLAAEIRPPPRRRAERRYELTFDPTNAVSFLTPRGPFHRPGGRKPSPT